MNMDKMVKKPNILPIYFLENPYDLQRLAAISVLLRHLTLNKIYGKVKGDQKSEAKCVTRSCAICALREGVFTIRVGRWVNSDY